MKTQIILGIISFIFLLGRVSFAQLSKTSDSFSMPKNTSPKIFQKMGNEDLELPRSKWPVIENCQGSQSCCMGLEQISGKYLPGSRNDDYKPYADLELEVKVSPEFRSTSKLLVSWTIRVVTSEINKTLPYNWNASNPSGGSCSEAVKNGISTKQLIPKGEVKTKLFVDNIEKSNVVSMVFPGGAGSTNIQLIEEPENPPDPQNPPSPPNPNECKFTLGRNGSGNKVYAGCDCPAGFIKKTDRWKHERCYCEDSTKVFDWYDGECKVPFDCLSNAGAAHFSEGICDPTITGSYVLRKEDFGGQFPAIMKLQVRIHNDTAWNLVSLANQHNIVVTQFPVTKE